MDMYVLQVKPSSEEYVVSELRKLGFNAMCPTEKIHIRRGGQWHEAEKLLFTQYVFVECDLTDKSYYSIRSVFGTVRFLGFGKPEPLKKDEQEQIRLLNNGGKPIEASKIYVTSTGEKMIMSGILRDHSDSIIYLDLRQRKAKVRIRFADKEHVITLPVIGI